VGIFTAISNRNQNMELAKINAKLASQKSEEDALREYRFDALKRMYNEFEPISFEFNEACDNAIRRILLLARNAKEGKIRRFRDDKGFLAPDRDNPKHLGRYLNETTYLLLAPMAYFKIFQKRLTSIDLQLDQSINFLFLVSKDLYYTLQADDDLANTEPKLSYDPNSSKMDDNPAEHSIQGINIITLDKIPEELLYEDDRVIPLPVFLEKFGKELKKASSDQHTHLVRYYYPSTLSSCRQTSFWRILLTQLCLYKAMKKISQLREQKIIQSTDSGKNTAPMKEVYNSIEQIYKSFEGTYANSELDWGQENIKSEQTVDKGPLTAVKNYLTREVRY
jgi:hypothetical protein